MLPFELGNLLFSDLVQFDDMLACIQPSQRAATAAITIDLGQHHCATWTRRGVDTTKGDQPPTWWQAGWTCFAQLLGLRRIYVRLAFAESYQHYAWLRECSEEEDVADEEKEKGKVFAAVEQFCKVSTLALKLCMLVKWKRFSLHYRGPRGKH
jgi:hypothetical protein